MNVFGKEFSYLKLPPEEYQNINHSRKNKNN